MPEGQRWEIDPEDDIPWDCDNDLPELMDNVDEDDEDE